MPNMIELLLRVEGPPAVLRAFLERYCEPARLPRQARVLSLERIVPLGAEATRRQREDAWGCRRDIDGGTSALSCLETGTLYFSLNTPVTLPDLALIQLARLEPDLCLSGAFVEEIVESCGRFRVYADRLGYFDLRGGAPHPRPSRQDPLTRSILAEVLGERAVVEYTGVD